MLLPKIISQNYEFFFTIQKILAQSSIFDIDLCDHSFSFKFKVVDWTRTDLEFEWNDGSLALKFDFDAFAAFDLFLMNRKNAEKDYSKEQLERAKNIFDKMTDETKEKLINTIVKGLPGRTSEVYTMEKFREAVEAYDDISNEEVRENLFDFVHQIMPVAEEHGVLMAIHPDDPPISLLGLPRIVSTASDVRKIMGKYNTFSILHFVLTVLKSKYLLKYLVL